MRKEKIELLKQDLYARIPYGVKAKAIYIEPWTTAGRDVEGIVQSAYLDSVVINRCHCELRNTVLFLRPMSDITKEEKEYVSKELGFDIDTDNVIWGGIDTVLGTPLPFNLDDMTKLFSWLNKNQFDYRGLIEKGLAIAFKKE
jgi:hypothetical protein